MGEGSFGRVERWVKTSDRNKDQLAIKYISPFQQEAYIDEYNISKFLTQLLKRYPFTDFSVVPSYIPKVCQGLNIIILHGKDGDLKSFGQKLFQRDLESISKNIISKYIYKKVIP